MAEWFRSVTEYPSRQDAVGIVLRLLDGIGHRYYWATEGLREEDYAFSPGGDCMTIGQLVEHVWGLSNWVYRAVVGADEERARPKDPSEQRAQALGAFAAIRARIASMEDEAMFAVTIREYPFWNVINGPLSDALAHTGQIASLRRINGNPVPGHSVFHLQHPPDPR